MIKLTAKIRELRGRKARVIKDANRIPAISYGHKIKNTMLDVDSKEFQKVYSQAGGSSLIELDVEGEKEKRIVLVHDYQRDAVTDQFIHIDFFETSAKEEVEVKVPLVFEGTSLAVKDLGGTLIKNISELELKALPQNLPHEIKVSIDSLNTFADHILVKDLILPKDVKISAKPEEIVVSVAEPEKVEEELAAVIEEKVEDVEKVEKLKKEADVVEETAAEKKPEKK